MAVDAVDAGGDWSDRSDGHAISITFSAPTIEAGLARAVEGFADALGEVHPSMATEHHRFVATAATPSALLLAVLEECLRCRREGRYVVALRDAVLIDGGATATIDTVPADSPRVQPTLPPVMSWHEVALEPGTEGDWSGRIVAR